MHFGNKQKNLLTSIILMYLVFAPNMRNKPLPEPKSKKSVEVKKCESGESNSFPGKYALGEKEVEVKKCEGEERGSKLEKLCFEEIIEKQFSLHESMQVQDMYKLLCQAEFGSTHVISDVVYAQKYFEYEYNKTIPNEKEELLEQVSPDGKIYRINFGAYKARFGDAKKELLYNMFIESSREFKRSDSLEGLIEKWFEFKKINNQKNYFTNEEIAKFEHLINLYNFPLVHHSQEYEAKNRPAYRIVHINIVKKYLPQLFSDNVNDAKNHDIHHP